MREPAFIMEPTVAAEAEGVEIRRTIGGERLVLLDPFLLLDHLRIEPGAVTEPVGFHRHPHRGIETMTYVFKGAMHHGDSLGNDSLVGAGGAQWMTAGDGIWHQEMLVPSPEGVEALQIWFNLPRAQKRVPAKYLPAQTTPSVNLGQGATARVVAGRLQGVQGVFLGIAVEPLYAVVEVPAGATVRVPAPSGHTCLAYVVGGQVRFGAQVAEAARLVVFADGDGVEATAETDATFVFVSAAPLNEPVLQYRSFVMNTADDIRETLAMIEADTFAR